MSFNKLVDLYWDRESMDLVIIDAEDHEDKIILNIDFEKTRPKSILFESHNFWIRKNIIQEYLTKNHYNVIDVGGDSVAIIRNL